MPRTQRCFQPPCRRHAGPEVSQRRTDGRASGGSTLKLRDYQQAAVDAVYNHLRNRDDNPVAVLPTGAGKSLVLAKIASDAVSRWGGRVLVLAHVKELLEQNADKVRRLCPNIEGGLYSAG